MSQEKGKNSAIIAIIALVFIVAGVFYYNLRPADEIMADKASEQMKKGQEMMHEGEKVYEEGEEMMKKAEDMRDSI